VGVQRTAADAQAALREAQWLRDARKQEAQDSRKPASWNQKVRALSLYA
jgi:hypothetical protein